ncbi:hypothetical protein Tco_1547248 [Tanacetum coccineum]
MDDIDRLLKCRFKKICDSEKQSEEIQEDFSESVIEYECDTNAPIKHALPCDDAASVLIVRLLTLPKRCWETDFGKNDDNLGHRITG